MNSGDGSTSKRQLEKCRPSESDSSDEEDMVENYDVVSALSHFNSEQSSNKDQGKDYLSGYNYLSFIAHAVGIQLLYSKPVQQRYYRLKDETLTYGFTSQTSKDIPLAIKNSLHHTSQHHDREKGHGAWERDGEAIEQKTVELINNKRFVFYTSVLNNELSDFFKDLIEEYDLNSGDFLGWKYQPELGNLTIVQKVQSESSPNNYSYDLSESDSFALDFLANLRLHNRINKRKLKYQKGKDFIENSTWKYSNNVTITINHSIRTETNTCSRRKEYVTFRDSFESYSKILELEIVSSGFDAKFLQQIFHSHKASIVSSDFAKLHYLLFGTEAVRNPSALIHNSMLLDLISAGDLSWEGAFKGNTRTSGGIMPMSMSGAVGASRAISSCYKSHMPSNYSYDDKPAAERSYESANYLLQKEQEITKLWLFMKMGSNFYDYLDDNEELKIGKVQEIFQMIQASCQQWFSINLLHQTVRSLLQKYTTGNIVYNKIVSRTTDLYKALNYTRKARSSIILLNVHKIKKDFSANDFLVGLYLKKVDNEIKAFYVDPTGYAINSDIHKILMDYMRRPIYLGTGQPSLMNLAGYPVGCKHVAFQDIKLQSNWNVRLDANRSNLFDGEAILIYLLSALAMNSESMLSGLAVNNKCMSSALVVTSESPLLELKSYSKFSQQLRESLKLELSRQLSKDIKSAFHQNVLLDSIRKLVEEKL